jgi:hypothetical protein
MMPAAYVLIIFATLAAFVPIVIGSIRRHHTLIAAINVSGPGPAGSTATPYLTH